MSDLKVSIIVTSYNKELFITETLNSIQLQLYKNIEVIIVDDCSTDNSKRLIEEYLKDDRFKFYKNELNKGANYCRNFGASIATSQYLFFLDADDLLAINCVEDRLKFMKKYPEIDFTVFPMGTFKKAIGDNNYTWIPTKDKALERFLAHRLPWTICQPLWKKDSFMKLGGFDESFSRMQDVELHTRALFEGLKFEVVASSYKPDCFYRIDEFRIIDHQAFIVRFNSAVIQYYNKFESVSQKKKLLGYLKESLVETSMYCNVYILNNKIDSITLKQILNEYGNVAESFVLNVYFKLMYWFFSLKIYPKGLKQLFKFLVHLSFKKK
jgi:glycosyltransferase involved in cell wall biosynthesis